MIDFGAFVDLRDVQNGLRRLQLAGHDLRPVFKRARHYLRADQREHAKARMGSSASWPELSPTTLLQRKQRSRKQSRYRQGRKRRRGRNFRGPLGRLPNAYKIEYDARRIVARSRVPWSGVHWKGGKAGHKARIPQREFLWISNQLLVAVSRLAVDYIAGAWDKES